MLRGIGVDHVTLTTRGDWLRKLAHFLAQRRPKTMTFQTPIALWALLLIPVVLLGYALVQRQDVKYAVRNCCANLRPARERHAPARPVGADTFPPSSTSSRFALVVSLARPHAVILVPKEQATVMLVMDVSGSMDATDVAPSRLVAAQSAARSLPGPASQHRSRRADFVLVERPDHGGSDDGPRRRSAARSTLLRSSGGTAMGDGLVRALEIQIATDAAPVGLTTSKRVPGRSQRRDGATRRRVAFRRREHHGHQPAVDAAEQATQLGVPVYTIALGTPDGTITVPTGRGGAMPTINVPPDLDTLKQIAEVTGASFFEAPTENDLRAIYQDLGSRVGFTEEEKEVTALFAGLGMVFMLFGGALAAVWFNRIP